MAVLDTRPQSVDVAGYAGDTLTITIQAPSSVTDGRTWSAQIRPDRSSGTIDAVFAITPPALSGGEAYLVLDAETTAALILGGAVVRRPGASQQATTGLQYTGEWDCQVVDASTTRTLVQGTLTISQDVTRLGAAR